MDRDGMDTRGIRSDHPRKTMNRKILGNGRSGCFLRTRSLFDLVLHSLEQIQLCIYIHTVTYRRVVIIRLFFEVRSFARERKREKDLTKERSVSMLGYNFLPFSRYITLLFPSWIVWLNKRPPLRKALIIRNALRTTFMVATLVSR